MNSPEDQFTCIPNFIFDRYLGVLTPNEFKVVAYVARRTLGFQRETDRISLSQFANGLPGKDTGTGLSIAAVRKALAELQRLEIIYQASENDKHNMGAEWGLMEQTADQLAALDKRIVEQSSKGQRRTEKAREKLKAKRLLSDNTGSIVGQHAPSMSDNTQGRLSDNTILRKKEERKILETPNGVSVNAQSTSDPKPIGSGPEFKEKKSSAKRKEPKVRAPTPRDAVTNAIAFGAYGMKKGDGFNASQGAIVISDQLGDSPTAEAILRLADRITEMYPWYKLAHSDLDPPAKASSIIKYLNEHAESKVKANGHNATAPAHKPNYGF